MLLHVALLLLRTQHTRHTMADRIGSTQATSVAYEIILIKVIEFYCDKINLTGNCEQYEP